VQYRCEATTLEGFLWQLAVCYVGRGYWFYVTGFVPFDKDPDDVDRKLIAKYGIDISKWSRWRKKEAGTASVQYIRYQRFFLLLATNGKHRFKVEEKKNIRDVRREPIKFNGYAVGCSNGQVHVRIDREEYLDRKAYFVGIATKRSASSIVAELRALPFEPYRQIQIQYREIIDAINDARAQAGLSQISSFSVRRKRRICRPFEPVVDDDDTLKTGTG
jgi:hypothetical protein